jgi:HSP20 family protein
MEEPSTPALVMKRADLDRLFVTAEEMYECMSYVTARIARRAYEIFESRGNTHGHDLEDWFQAESEVLRPMTLEMEDSGDAFIAVATVDGHCAEDLRISVEGRCLRICGPFAAEGKPSDTMEEPMQQSQRVFLSFCLPTEVNTSKISAGLRDDILEVRLPKVFSPVEGKNQTADAN